MRHMLPLQAWNTLAHSILTRTKEEITKGGPISPRHACTRRRQVPSPLVMAAMPHGDRLWGWPTVSTMAAQKAWRGCVVLFLKTDSNKYRCATLGNPRTRYGPEGSNVSP